MTKQLICDISNAVKLKYVKTTRWVWAGVDNGLFRPTETDESYSLEIEHYDVVFDPSSADEDEKLPVPYAADLLISIESARKIGEALSLEDSDPFLITINGRKYYRYRVWDIPMDGNEVIDWHRYLSKAVSERCPDGWAGELPDYIEYLGSLYRAETEETDERVIKMKRKKELTNKEYADLLMHHNEAYSRGDVLEKEIADGHRL